MHVPASLAVLVRASVPRLVVHAVAAWALTAVFLVAVLSTLELPLSGIVYAAGAPGLTALVVVHYGLHRQDAADPLTTAVWFTAIAASLDVLAELMVQGRLALFDPAVGLGIPLMLVFGATGLTMELVPREPARRAG